MKIKCQVCGKKVKSIIPTPCKCGQHLCYNHKYEHDCGFNYLKEQQERLQKQHKHKRCLNDNIDSCGGIC